MTGSESQNSASRSKTRFRIDGAVAAAMAIGLKARDVQGEAAAEPEIVFL
jgi:hypothetical protein